LPAFGKATPPLPDITADATATVMVYSNGQLKKALLY